MTPFAAVLSRCGGAPDPETSARVADALSNARGTIVARHGRCHLLGPLDGRDHRGPLASPGHSDVFVEGQILIEGAAGLAAALGLRAQVSTAGLVAGAYLRWGPSCTDRLSGEFAFVLWDPRQEALLAARDGLGVRQLFVGEAPDTIVVTNVLAAAVAGSAASPELDDVALQEYLAGGHPRDECRTAYRAVRRIPAGHTLRIASADGIQLRRHWWFPQPAGSRPRTGEEIADAYRAVLGQAVADRMHDARTSILLSGGIDSTTIAAAARECPGGGALRAFTAVYQRLPGLDEPALADSVARALDIKLTRVRGDAHHVLHGADHGAPTPEPLDEPALSDWRVLIASAAAHSPVVLYGEDGDALFAPPGLRAMMRADSIGHIARDICRYAAAGRRLPYLGLRVRERLFRLVQGARSTRPRWLAPAGKGRFQETPRATVLGTQPTPLPPHPSRPRTQERLVTGIAGNLSRIICTEVTRSEAELRCPLLDSRVLQFVVDLPPIPWCQEKRLPRHAYRGVLPDAVISRPKAGVAGMYEALVAEWHSSERPQAAAVHPVIERWVDVTMWRQALESPDAAEVLAAWRVLQLNAWLERPRQLSPPAAAALVPACIQ